MYKTDIFMNCYQMNFLDSIIIDKKWRAFPPRQMEKRALYIYKAIGIR